MNSTSTEKKNLPFKAFWAEEISNCREIVNGLVHETYMVRVGEVRYILQKVNTYVFKEADKILSNIQTVNLHLNQDDSFTLQVPQLKTTVTGDHSHISASGDLWRCFFYIDGDTRTMISNQEEAFGVAKAFGQFSAALSTLQPDSLYYTIVGFHDAKHRLDQFDLAVKVGEPARIDQCSEEIRFIEQHSFIAHKIQHLNLPVKVAHNDPKLSNVLFDQYDRICAVIDLDTIMPGSPLHDFGDLVRSMAASMPEDHERESEIHIQWNIYENLKKGFLEGAGDSLSSEESRNLGLGAAYIIYEQALRFLADYLVGDIYYKTHHDIHNLVRAKNQIQLLRSFLEKTA